MDGVATPANANVVQGRTFATAIARSAWPIELDAGAKPRLAWLTDDYYEIPYKRFLPRRGVSLLAASRPNTRRWPRLASRFDTSPTANPSPMPPVLR